ncbi:MAG: cation:dicarboxylase symporter family transporter [Pirellulales bacterium]|nr:cation:dicarboxylase symporter family transporter [Pirellulales bacterium]
MNTTEAQPPRSGHALGLICILIGALLAVAVGAIWGQTMWLAAGGPERAVEELEKTARQKERFAEDAQRAGNRKEADRLRAQVPLIEKEIERNEALRREAARRPLGFARGAFELIRFCGDVFLRMLLMIVVPLVLTSMVCGITSLGDMGRMGKVGLWTLAYYLITGAVAVVLGIAMVEIIRPGAGLDDTFAYVSEELLNRRETSVVGTILEVVVGRPDDPAGGLIPKNIVAAAGESNIMATILFSLLFGGALAASGAKGKPAVDFFQAANEAIMKVVRLILFFAPAGIFGLIVTRIVVVGGARGVLDEAHLLGWLVLTVALGLFIHTIVLCLLLWIFGRRNPWRYFAAMARALLTALSTSSSSATLPMTIECAEEAGVSQRSAGFVLPLGATINMDGTALYEAVAAIFIAQAAGVPLGPAALVVIFLTATVAAIGAPGIPEAGLVTLLIVLTAVGLPTAGIGTILAIDWFLDRQRTAVNVFGDAVGAAVIDRWLKK